ncbi:hypothetical protein D3C85_1154710 [compost metagenome]
MHLAAAGADHDIDPPVMGDHLHVRTRGHQKPAGGIVENHGVAASDILHQRIGKCRLAGKPPGSPDEGAVLVYQLCASAI